MALPRKKELDLNGFLALRANSGFMEGAAQVGDDDLKVVGVTSSIYSLRLETFFFFKLSFVKGTGEKIGCTVYTYIYIHIWYALPSAFQWWYLLNVPQICVYCISTYIYVPYMYIYIPCICTFIYVYLVHYIQLHLFKGQVSWDFFISWDSSAVVPGYRRNSSSIE